MAGEGLISADFVVSQQTCFVWPRQHLRGAEARPAETRTVLSLPKDKSGCKSRITESPSGEFVFQPAPFMGGRQQRRATTVPVTGVNPSLILTALDLGGGDRQCHANSENWYNIYEVMRLDSEGGSSS